MKGPMKVETVELDALAGDPRNARRHDRRNVEAIKRSLIEFGQQKPIVIDKGGKVIAGNGTLAAACELGWETIAVVRTDLAGHRAAAYGVADNRTAELAEWDDPALAEIMRELQASDIDPEIMGFTSDEVADLVDAANAEASVKPMPVKPPPRYAWVLIGIEAVRYGEIAESVEAIGAIPGVICETAMNNGPDGPDKNE